MTTRSSDGLLHGRTALVTGAASGTGAAIARRAAADGVEVYASTGTAPGSGSSLPVDGGWTAR